MIVMLSHGLVSGALFLCVGVIYDRLHTREIDRYGGLSINMPKYALFFMLFTMASVGLPGTSGFVGEFLSADGRLQVSSWVALVATTGIILGAAYMLYLYRRVCFGEQKNADAAAMPDLEPARMVMLAPIAAFGAVDGRLSRKLPGADARRYRRRSTPAWRPRAGGDAKLTAGKPHAAAEHENHEATNEHGGPATGGRTDGL
jgi:NADH-quinone oxidoreductase subunit M